MDKLEELFRLQMRFQQNFGFWPELYKIISAMMAESGELWGKSGGKWWKKHNSTKEEQVDELVDILHFFLMACLELKMTPQELFDAYVKKLDVNYKRQKEGY